MLITMTAIGNLGADPVVRKGAASGRPFATFQLAVNLSPDDTLWLDVIAFGEAAKKIARVLHRGDLVYCEGIPRPHAWADKRGTPRASIRLSLREFRRIGGGSRTQSDKAPIDEWRHKQPDQPEIPF